VIATLGVSSTLIAWYLARTRESDKPHKSCLCVQDLGHILHEVESFILDCGHKPRNKWEDKINGFRLALEKSFGINPLTDPNSMADSNANRGKGSESGASSKGDA